MPLLLKFLPFELATADQYEQILATHSSNLTNQMRSMYFNFYFLLFTALKFHLDISFSFLFIYYIKENIKKKIERLELLKLIQGIVHCL